MAIEPARPIDGLFSDLMTVVEVPVTDEDDGVDSPSGLQVIYGRSPLYSFGPDEYGYLYLGSTARLVISDDQRTLLMWIEKALRTPRGQYSIYGPDYGTNIAAAVGGNGSLQELLLDGPADIKRCLLLHPLIEEIRDVRFLRAGGDGDSIQIHLTIVEKLAGLTPLVFLIGEGSAGIPGFTPPTPDPSPVPLTPIALDGVIADSSSLSGALRSGPSLAGTFSSAGSLVATDLTISEDTAAQIANVSSLSGGLTLVSAIGTPLDPEIDDVGTIDGLLTASWALSGSITSSSSLTSDSISNRPVAGTIADQSSLAVTDLSIARSLSGNLVDLGTFDAPLIVQRSLAGAFSDVSALAASLPTSWGLAGSSNDSSALAADLTVTSPPLFALVDSSSTTGSFVYTSGAAPSFTISGTNGSVAPAANQCQVLVVMTRGPAPTGVGHGFDPVPGDSFAWTWTTDRDGTEDSSQGFGFDNRSGFRLTSFVTAGGTSNPEVFTVTATGLIPAGTYAWAAWLFRVTGALGTFDPGGSFFGVEAGAFPSNTTTITGTSLGDPATGNDLYVLVRGAKDATTAPWSGMTGAGSLFNPAGATKLAGIANASPALSLELWLDLSSRVNGDTPAFSGTSSVNMLNEVGILYAFKPA